MKNRVATIGRHLRANSPDAPPQDWSALMPCPFCGGNGRVLLNRYQYGGGSGVVICERPGCGCGGPFLESNELAPEEIERIAIAKWNRRGNAVGAELKLRRIAQLLNSDAEVA